MATALKAKSGLKVLCAPRMESERASPAKSRKRWGAAFGRSTLKELSEANEIAKVLDGRNHPKRHSDGETPWQFVLGDYQVRFSDKTPRGTARRDGGSWGIYLRAYNVRVATFADNSDHLREALMKMFDAAHARSESQKEAERQFKGSRNK